MRFLVVLSTALLLAACATGGPAGVAPRIGCSDARQSDPGMQPLFFIFCVQSP